MTIRKFSYDFIIPAIGYFFVAQLSLLLAVPPSDAAAVWPPAGIAIATILLRGYRSWIAIYISEIAVNSISWVDTTSTMTLLHSGGLIFLLSIGPTIQAVFVAYLVKRFSEPRLIFFSESSIVKFMLVLLPLGCLGSASWGMATLFHYGIVQASEVPLSWLTWWAGDTIGAVTVTPLLLIFLLPNSSDLKSRRLSVGVPMLMLLAIVIGLFQFSQSRDETENRSHIELQAHRQHNNLEAALERGLNAVYALKFYFEGSEHITPEEFARFSTSILERNSHIHALEWIPKVEAAQKAAFERNPDGPGKITEMDAQGNLTTAGPRDVYYPVKYVRPLQGNERAYGYDVSSNPTARQAQHMALKTGEATATQPITLIQENQGQNGLVVYLPVHLAHGFAGYVATVIRTTEFIESIVGRSSNNAHNLMVRLSDVTGGTIPIFDNIIPEEIDQGAPFVFSKQFHFCGRQWRIDYYPTSEFFQERTGWSSLMILLGGMLFTAVIGGWLLSLTGRTLQISREVDRRTHELRQEAAERELVQKELSKLSLAVEHSPSMVLISDPLGNIEYINPKFSEVSGYSLEELKGKNANELYVEQYGPGYYDGLIRQLDANSEWKGEINSRKQNGEAYWTQVLLAPIYNQHEQLTHIVSVHQDITENKLINEKMSYQARHDRLTGLINRYEFERRLQLLLDGLPFSRHSHAFFFCDLDQFKVINDVSGHTAGDELLRQVADLLRATLRKEDLVARLGGDEFGILMENCSMEEAQQVAGKILSELDGFRFVWDGAPHTLGISIGIVAIDEHSRNITDILKNADSACYTAKDAGRNRIHTYKTDDQLLAKRESEIHWVGEINHALEKDQFQLHGQIIVPIHDDRLKPSIEVLVRMDKEGELVMPGAFLPAAERYGLSAKLDRWVVEHAFQWLAGHPNLDQLIDSLAINLCALSLSDSKLLQFIYQELDKRKFAPGLVKFEITETSAIANLSETQEFIKAVKKYGCGFSLDDFGSGMSSFAYLKNLPVDCLKIDGMFVKDITDDPIDRAMVKSINEVGQIMQKKTIAEFVENDEILTILRELGVDYAQGYGIGVPKPLETVFEEIVAKAAMTSGSSVSSDYGDAYLPTAEPLSLP